MENQSFFELLLGTKDVAYFFTAFFFALVGVLVSLLLHANNRAVDSTSTPFKFSYKFLIGDNWKRILLSLVLIFVSIRFIKELFHVDLSMFWALIVGLGLDKLSQLLKDKTNNFFK